MSDSPAVVLRQAAARVRETGAACEPDTVFLRDIPWHAEKDQGGGRTVVLQGGEYPADYVQPVRRVADATAPGLAAWIALMYPGLAEPLAAWLEETAGLHEQNTLPGHANIIPPGCQWCADEDWPCADTRRALAVARAILGTTKETT